MSEYQTSARGAIEYLYRLSCDEDWAPSSQRDYCREDYIRVGHIIPLEEFCYMQEILDLAMGRWQHFGLPRSIRRHDIINVRFKNTKAGANAVITMPVVCMDRDACLFSGEDGRVGVYTSEEDSLSLLVSKLRWKFGNGKEIGL